jgi:Spy/CpxP family protein refolding chaperone
MKLNSKTLLALIALAASPVIAFAQDNNQPGGERRERGERGNFNPEEFRQRMAQRMKETLKVTDDEWAVLQPMVEKVTNAQRNAMGGFGGFGGRGDRGPGGPGGDGNRGGGTSDRPGSAERAALRTALESDSTSAEDIKAKLEAVREVRKKQAAELAAAREELKKVVTVRQEAVLVSMGILE